MAGNRSLRSEDPAIDTAEEQESWRQSEHASPLEEGRGLRGIENRITNIELRSECR